MAMQFQKFDSQTLIVPDSDALAQATAELLIKAFSKILTRKQTVFFIPSSGQTPLKTYQLLARRYKTALDWSRITLVQMDEYWPGADPAILMDEGAYFYHFLQSHLVRPLDVGAFISIRKPGGGGPHSPKAYSEILSSLGPIDFALHGIGRNGHIGFNEPGSCIYSKTRIVDLAPATRSDNFPNLSEAEAPKYGITLGLKTLRQVNHTLLIATGAHKASAIRNLVGHDPVSKTPACILWDSPDFGLIIDQAAASNLGL
jgi:glucosamine-6-phosphate deaminase